MNSKALFCLCLWQFAMGSVIKFDTLRSTVNTANDFTLTSL